MTGKQFRKLREQLGYTRTTLAQDIGVSWETIKSWETRKKDLPVPEYARLAISRIPA